MAIIGALSLTEGDKSLKSVDGNIINQNDICITVDTDGVYFHRLTLNFDLEENIPYVIKPAVDAFDKRWVLTSVTKFSNNIVLRENLHVQTPEIRELDNNEGIIFSLSDGTQICRINSDGLIINRELIMVQNNLNVENINDTPVDNFIRSDGSVSFTDEIAGVDPTSSNHLTTKNYVDSNFVEYDNTTSYSPSGDYNPVHVKYVEDNFLSKTNTTSYSPSGDYNPATKLYVDRTKWVEWEYVNSSPVNTEPHKGYIVDANSEEMNILLPSSTAEIGDSIAVTVIDITHTVKIDRNGGKILGQEDDLFIDVNDSGLTLVYTGTSYGWAIVSEISGVSPLDGDTVQISWNPSYYTPDNSITEADTEDDLAAHLKGIDNKFLQPEEFETTGEPEDPPQSRAILYFSDGTAGDENVGDFILKLNIGGVVKKRTLTTF